MQKINFGTLNLNGCKTHEEKLQTIAEDAYRYNIQILGVTETHLPEEETLNIEVKDKKKKYIFYNSGIKEKNIFTGTGILIEENIEAKFKRISDRICTAKINLGNKHKVMIIIVYAPTLNVSENQPQVREDFYELLQKTTNKINKSRYQLVVMGDFNAKTGSGYNLYKENMGPFGKGMLNTNGSYLLEYTKINGMYLTNTTFNHKMAHRTTWTAPERKEPVKHHDGTPRINPYRNQIDYILTKCEHKKLITDSRSYGGFTTKTDHKLIKMSMNLQWWKLTRNISKIWYYWI